MPTYEYRCRACGHGFDIQQSFKDEALTICPACGGELRKVYAPPAISFKGSGFYATDSRRGAKSSDGKDGSKDATSSPKKEGAAASDAGSSGGSKTGSSGSSSSSGSKDGGSSGGSTTGASS